MMTGLAEKPDWGLRGEGGLSTVRFAQWRAFLPHSGLQPRPSPMIPASPYRAQGKHPLQVPGHGHEVTLAPDIVEESNRNRGSAPGDWQGVGGESPLR